MQAVLSEHWHAVRSLRPRLRDGVQPLHRRLRRRSWVLLSDPVTQRFHRMTPEVWRVLALCDGRRTLDEVWQAACAQSRHSGTISQHELVQLISALHSNDLLQTQVSPDASEVFERFQRQRQAKFKQNFLNLMSIRWPLFHPDAWFSAQTGLARALFRPWVGLLWLALVLPAAGLAVQHWTALTENLSDRVLSASNLLALWLVYPVVKAVHEWAHGLAVKAYGGQVRELGLMFILFMPVPYVDASSSYRFPSKWARAQVAAAGIMAELALGALALYLWLAAEPGLTTALAYNVILIAGVSTLLVNGNPLMRYDGYFIVTDLLELPNLAQRAQHYWVYLSDRFLLGALDAQPPLASARGERWILAIYGVIAPVYRLLITIGLIWFVAGEYLLIGAVMAMLAAGQALVMPFWKAWKHLDEGASLARRRGPAKRRSVLLGVGLLAFLGLVPLPFYSVHQGVVWLPDEALVRANSAGQIRKVMAAPGTRVRVDAPLLQLENLPLQAELTAAAAVLAQTEAQLRRAEVAEPVRIGPLKSELAARQARFAQAEQRVLGLEVHATRAGAWVPAAPTELAGRSVKRGDVLGYLVAGATDRVRVAVTQEDADLVKTRLQAVQVHPLQSRGGFWLARVRREIPGGGFELVSPALGTPAGGEIAVDPAKEGGRHSLKRVFDFELQLDQPSPSAVFGDRVLVRFDLGATPLAAQWVLRLRQAFLARLNV